MGEDKNSWKLVREFPLGPTAQSTPKHGPRKHTSQPEECTNRSQQVSLVFTGRPGNTLIVSADAKFRQEVALLVKLWHKKIVSALKYCKDRDQKGPQRRMCVMEDTPIVAASSITQWEFCFRLRETHPIPVRPYIPTECAELSKCITMQTSWVLFYHTFILQGNQ